MTAPCRFGLAVLLTLARFPFPVSRVLTAQDATKGKAVYVKWCGGCHGDGGAGDGPAASHMLPRPRDFTGAIYKIRATASGQLPTDQDVLRSIDDGLPGTAMPAWKDRLSERERRDVVAYLKTFSAFFQDTSQRVVPLTFAKEPGGARSAEALRVGRQFYDSMGCWKCHGKGGRGDGPSAPTLKTDPGEPIFAADLHESWRFGGGAGTADIYRRLRTGLEGTLMPSFSDLIDKKFLTDEQLWRVAQYVRSLSPERAPEVRDVIHAPRLPGGLPRSPDDSAWARVERYWFPLVGQVIRKPRWFAPAVAGVWAQAVHTADSLALRLEWDDRSESPDTTWLEFERRVLDHVTSDDSVPARADLLPDGIAVQFSRPIPAGMERPYFLMGTASDPVYQWRWTSMPRQPVAGLARGLSRFDVLREGSAPGAAARFADRQWRLVLTAALATADTANELHFEPRRPIPVAFFAWDGSNGEHDTRMAVSAWYFLALDQPTPPRGYLSPVVAMPVPLGPGMLVAGRAHRRRS